MHWVTKVLIFNNPQDQIQTCPIKNGNIKFNHLYNTIMTISYRQLGGSGESGEDDDGIEVVHIDEDFFYMEHIIKVAAMLHSIVSLAILIGYYHLKVRGLGCGTAVYFTMLIHHHSSIFPGYIVGAQALPTLG